jgi:hypothetical protein
MRTNSDLVWFFYLNISGLIILSDTRKWNYKKSAKFKPIFLLLDIKFVSKKLFCHIALKFSEQLVSISMLSRSETSNKESATIVLWPGILAVLKLYMGFKQRWTNVDRIVLHGGRFKSSLDIYQKKIDLWINVSSKQK